MSRRTLSLAAAVLWISALGPAAAQNLEAGKSPSQIFAATCAICHKSPHGLLKSVSPGALPGFLRQHYTTSVGMAGAMSAYVLSNGAANRRAGDDLTREGRELTSPKPREPEAETREKQERHIDRAEKPARGHVAKPREESSPEADTKDKKPKVNKRKPKNAPAKDEPKDTSRPKPDESKPETPAAESSKPAAAPEPAVQPESKPAAPAPEVPAKKPDEDKPASNMPVFNVAPNADAKSETAPAAPAPEKPAESAPAAQ